MSSPLTEENYEYIFKVILIGSAGVGKSSILQRYIQKIFTDTYSCTIGVDFFMKSIEIEGKNVKMQIWDTAGTEKYRSITTSYYRGAHAAFIVFDLTNKESFEALPQWIENYFKYSNKDLEKNIILIGNKNDLVDKRIVTELDIENFAKINKMKYFETSAKNDVNIEESFRYIAEKLYKEYKEKYGEGSTVRKNNVISDKNLKNNQSLIGNNKCCF